MLKANIGQYKQMDTNLAGKSDDEILQNIVNSGYLQALITTVRDDYTMECLIKSCTFID